MSAREKLLHPATFISLIALFVALGGVGYAAVKIGTKQIRNGAVTGKKLARGSVTTSKIRAGAVRDGDLANNSVSTQKIQPGGIISSDLAAGSVLNAALGNAAVTGSKIANETIGTQKLENGSVASDKIGTGAVIASKLGANSVTTPAIAPDSVTAAQIVNGQVVEGNGTLSAIEDTLGNGASNAQLLVFPGLGVLQADCAAGVATVEFANASGTSIDVRQWGVVNGAPDTPIVESNNPANGLVIPQSSAPNGIMGITWMASFGGPTNVHVATINTSTKNLGGTSCVISAQATYTS
jgi:hypothetical protein